MYRHIAVFFFNGTKPSVFFVHQSKSMNSETFTLRQGAPEVVGTCKLDTHEFNTNDLQKIEFYFEKKKSKQN